MIGRAITERPDLYKVAIARVGLLNTLRMEFSANGPGKHSGIWDGSLRIRI